MAYTIPWDESDPDGSITAASDIDAEFQQLKTALRERLEQVIPDFGDDMVDPKVIPAGSILLSHIHAESAGGATFSVSGSSPQVWSENINIGGDITIAGSLITLDTIGTYMFWVDALVDWSPYTPGAGNLGILAAAGTAVTHSVTQSFQEQGLGEVSLHGIAIATAGGESFEIFRQASIFGGGDICRFSDMGIMILRIA